MAQLSNTPRSETHLRLEARKSFSFALRLVDGNGRPLDLTGTSLELAATKRSSTENMITNSAADLGIAAASGYARFNLQASDLDHPAGEYPFAITLIDEGYSSVLVRGTLEILDNADITGLSGRYIGGAATSGLEVTLQGQLITVQAGPIRPPGDDVFTDRDRAKLDEIEPGAEVNVHADWSAGPETPGYIKNRPLARLVPKPRRSGQILVSTGSTDGAYLWSGTDEGSVALPADLFHNPSFTGTVSGLAKADVGLNNVNNTADANKPVSRYQQEALDLKLNITELAKLAVGRGELVVSIADYGVIGDGVADDQPGLQRAMNALRDQGGGILLLERGKQYRVSKSVQCTSKVVVLGNGAAMRKKDSSDWQYAIFQSRAGAGTGYGAGLKDFTVRDLKFIGDFTVGRSACAFAGHHAQNILFDNCTFDEFQGAGHSFDLAGCDGVTINKCTWRGFDNTHGASADAECIQIDNSLNGALSSTETVGNYDGLPTINVSVTNCEFLPVTVNGVDYPCPNPLGAHSRKEGAWHTNILFENNLIVDPVADTKSTFRGTIHLIASDGVRIIGNTWRVSPGKAAAASRAIGFYSFSLGEGVVIDPNTNSGAPLNPITPMNCKNIKIEGNTFIGFKHIGEDSNAISLIGSAAARIEDVTIRDNTFRDMTGGVVAEANQYADCIYATYVEGLEVDGNYASKCKRTLLANNCRDVRIVGGGSYDASFSALYLNNCSNVEIDGMNVVRAGSNSLLFSITGLIVHKFKAREPRHSSSPQAISIRDTTDFLVSECIVSRTSSTDSPGISIYGTSGRGFVSHNISSGYSTAVKYTGTGGSVTLTENL